MYAYIKGIVADIETDRIIIECNNIGYNVFVPSNDIINIGYIGRQVKLYTYLSVKEDAMNLFGFLTKDELQLFKLLIGVSGIGPKGALGILGSMSCDDLRFAIMSGDSKTISAAPGIGAKTAQKVILELKDKLKIEDLPVRSNIYGDAHSLSDTDDITNEAAMALTSLGYSQSEALRAIRKCNIDENCTAESLIKAALKQMV